MRAPTLIAIVSAALPFAHGHGMLVDPPSRNSVASDPKKCQGGGGCTGKSCGSERNPGCKEYNPIGLTGGSYGAKWPEILDPELHGLCGDVQGREPPSSWKDEPYLLPTPPQVTYTPGQIVEFKVEVRPEHGGFYSFRICDEALDGATLSSRAAGDACLSKWVLQRAHVETTPATEMPIDEKNPSRWYVPHNNNKTQGARFIIPKDLSCKKCTLQWFWMTGNSCAFDDSHISYCSRNACKFKDRMKETCKELGRAPELHWNCADIAVGSSPQPTPNPPQPEPNPPDSCDARLERMEKDIKSMKTMMTRMSKLLAGGSKPIRRRRRTRTPQLRRRRAGAAGME